MKTFNFGDTFVDPDSTAKDLKDCLNRLVNCRFTVISSGFTHNYPVGVPLILLGIASDVSRSTLGDEWAVSLKYKPLGVSPSDSLFTKLGNWVPLSYLEFTVNNDDGLFSWVMKSTSADPAAGSFVPLDEAVLPHVKASTTAKLVDKILRQDVEGVITLDNLERKLQGLAESRNTIENEIHGVKLLIAKMKELNVLTANPKSLSMAVVADIFGLPKLPARSWEVLRNVI
jgi:hypothetical protein